MKQKTSLADQTSELLILSDGTIFVHNLTPAMAGLLSELNPEDEAMRQRAEPGVEAAITDIHIDRHSL